MQNPCQNAWTSISGVLCTLEFHFRGSTVFAQEIPALLSRKFPLLFVTNQRFQATMKINISPGLNAGGTDAKF